MRYMLFIMPEAVEDIQKAIDYFNSEQEGLGLRFFAELELQFKSIEQNPQYRSVRYAHIRLARLDNFPYAAHYYYQRLQGNCKCRIER